ncbi:acetylcholine receptor subunit alpha-type acr-16 [Elysia marginata]|uniref:Acetylcholine receptor subunit alpha-type acr-16 n=1 Tax=Elysia marginata TaxID=1093978 RepID=A0AAV4FCQ5_9GAST|nr:acetylcholine receptor subunit alpha-type acr-16 [Elysia marginata]
MAMSALSVALSVFVLNCHHRGTSMKRPPRCVRAFSCFVARVLRMRLLHIKEVHVDNQRDSHISPTKATGKYGRSSKQKVNVSSVSRGRKPLCCTSSSPSDGNKANIYTSGGAKDASSSKSLLNRHNNGVNHQHRINDEGGGSTNVFQHNVNAGADSDVGEENSTPRLHGGSTRSCQLLMDDATSTAPLHRAPETCSVPSSPTRTCIPPPPPPPISPRQLSPNPDCSWCAEFRESGEFSALGQQSSTASGGLAERGGSRQSRKTHMEAQILYYLRAVLETFDKGQGERTAVMEWQEVARVLDKFFFWLFVMITSLTTVFLLLLSPVTKEVEFPVE